MKSNLIYVFIGVFFIFLLIYFGGRFNIKGIEDNNPVKYYEDNKNDFEIKHLNYEGLKIHYNSDVFRKCYEAVEDNNFLSCNTLFQFSNTQNFVNIFLNEGDEGKFLLGCLLKENGLYHDCFCKYATNYQICK